MAAVEQKPRMDAGAASMAAAEQKPRMDAGAASMAAAEQKPPIFAYSLSGSELTDPRMETAVGRPRNQRREPPEEPEMDPPEEPEMEPPEEPEMEPPEAQRAIAARTVGILNLGAKWTVERYQQRFGNTTTKAPYGDQIWPEMRRMLIEYRNLGGKGSPAGFSSFIPGFFRMPEKFSRTLAQLPKTDDEVCGPWYPAVFAVWDETHVAMWCENILIFKSKLWIVHTSRIHLLAEYTAYVNFGM